MNTTNVIPFVGEVNGAVRLCWIPVAAAEVTGEFAPVAVTDVPLSPDQARCLARDLRAQADVAEAEAKCRPVADPAALIVAVMRHLGRPLLLATVCERTGLCEAEVRWWLRQSGLAGRAALDEGAAGTPPTVRLLGAMAVAS